MSTPNPIGNRATRRAWNAMVRDARAVTAEIPITEDEVITVNVPDADRLTEVFQKRQQGDLFGALEVLLGSKDHVDRLRAVAAETAGEDGRVPITAWRDLMQQTMKDLGLGGDPEQ